MLGDRQHPPQRRGKSGFQTLIGAVSPEKRDVRELRLKVRKQQRRVGRGCRLDAHMLLDNTAPFRCGSVATPIIET